MLSSIIKVKDKVEYLLTYMPILRDSDPKLIARIWASESTSTTLKRDFLLDLGNGKLTSSEAITRCRRKLQEHNPDLRGKLYNKRHQNGATVKTHIKFLNF